ncbi:MAG: hypothetical protein AABO58_07195 [Acidobacteriota bacterium]
MSSENANFRGSLGAMRWTPGEDTLFNERFAEALRECGILWLVFALLDRTVTGTLTVPWAMWNFFASVVIWGFGIYIEPKKTR